MFGLRIKKSGSVYQVKKFNKTTQDPATKSDIEKAEKEETPKIQNKQDNGYIGSKDKTLSDIDTLKSEEFNKPLTPTDDEYNTYWRWD